MIIIIVLLRTLNYVSIELVLFFPYDKWTSKPIRELIILNHDIIGLNLKKYTQNKI